MNTMYPSMTDAEYLPEQDDDTWWDAKKKYDVTGAGRWAAINPAIIGVIGFGLVGKTVATAFQNLGHVVYVNDVLSDKVTQAKFPLVTKQNMMQTCDCIFICVNTPYHNGKTNIENVYNVIQQLSFAHQENVADPIIVIKSTVTPGTSDDLRVKYPKMTFASNPEFLREQSPLADFMNPDRVIIGAYDSEVIYQLETLYESFLNAEKIYVLTPKEAELAKYLSNSFLTLKVAFSQAVNTMCQLMNINADYVMRVVTKDRRINPSHLTPSKGQINSNSMCLPKDLLAFRDFLKDMKMDVSFFNQIYELAVKGGKS